jgi:drug/metabolite transporter (DMT)-like permease
MRDLILMLTTVLMGVGGQLLLKKGVLEANGLSFSEGVVTFFVKIVSSPFLLGGFTFYAGSAFLTLVVLSRIELGIFSLFTSLSYVIVLFAAALFFDEALTLSKILGAAFIVVGIYIIVK